MTSSDDDLPSGSTTEPPPLHPLLLKFVEAMARADVVRDIRDGLHFVWV